MFIKHYSYQKLIVVDMKLKHIGIILMILVSVMTLGCVESQPKENITPIATVTPTPTLISTPLPTATSTPIFSTINIEPAPKRFKVGETYTFVANPVDQYGKPVNAAVVWQSLDTMVGTITSSTGEFKAMSKGTVVLNPYSKFEGKMIEASVYITVD